MQRDFTVGIEEEFQLVDPDTRELRSSVTEILDSGRQVLGDQIKQEMFQAMVEVGTPICRDVEEARGEVVRLRDAVMRLAEDVGCKVMASGTHPMSHWENMDITPSERYVVLERDLQRVARTIAVYGLHVHVGLSDRDLAVEIMNE